VLCLCVPYVSGCSAVGCRRAILKANCYHEHGHDAHCDYDGNYYMLIFGGVQLLLSFIPDFHDMAWLSVVAAAMSFSYAFIGLGLGLARTIGTYTLCFFHWLTQSLHHFVQLNI
jgi:hypothetical protein